MKNKLDNQLIIDYIDLNQLYKAFLEIEKLGINDAILSKLKKEFTTGVSNYDVNFSDRLKTYVNSIPSNLRTELNSINVFFNSSTTENASDFVFTNIDRINKIIIDNWKIPKTKVPGEYSETFNRMILWFENFKKSEFDSALLILEAIQFITDHEIDLLIVKMCGELRKIFKNNFEKVIFAGLGSYSSNSGSQFMYKIRQTLTLKDIHFPSDYKNSLQNNISIVFIDDIIGSGNQAYRFWNSNLSGLKIEKYYYSLFAYEKGLKYLIDQACFKGVYSTKILTETEKAFSEVSEVFPDTNLRIKIQEISERYGKKLYPAGPLGYDNCQALIVFPHNTPNNSLPIIWASEKNEKEIGIPWNPIWERRK